MKYKRLTQWTENGASLVLDNPQNAEEARTQLMEKFKLSCNKLAELEDKIEQGTLIELPCKVGTIVYYVASLPITITKFFYRTIIYDIVEFPFTLEMLDTYGNNWFLTREEAEKRLKELQNG